MFVSFFHLKFMVPYCPSILILNQLINIKLPKLYEFQYIYRKCQNFKGMNMELIFIFNPKFMLNKCYLNIISIINKHTVSEFWKNSFPLSRTSSNVDLVLLNNSSVWLTATSVRSCKSSVSDFKMCSNPLTLLFSCKQNQFSNVLNRLLFYPVVRKIVFTFSTCWLIELKCFLIIQPE